MLRRGGDDAARAISGSRLAATVTRDLAGIARAGGPRRAGLDHAKATVAAALATLERLADDGWRAVLGDPLQGAENVRLGEDSVAERTEIVRPVRPGVGGHLLSRIPD